MTNTQANPHQQHPVEKRPYQTYPPHTLYGMSIEGILNGPMYEVECTAFERFDQEHALWTPRVKFITYGRCQRQWKREAYLRWREAASVEIEDAIALGEYSRFFSRAHSHLEKRFKYFPKHVYWNVLSEIIDPDFRLMTDSMFFPDPCFPPQSEKITPTQK